MGRVTPLLALTSSHRIISHPGLGYITKHLLGGVEKMAKNKTKKIAHMSTAERFVAGCRNPRASPHQEKAIMIVLSRR